MKVRVAEGKSYYDTETGELVIRKDLIGPGKEAEFEQVLEHELAHVRLGDNIGNVLYETLVDDFVKLWKIPFFIAILVGTIYFQFFYLPETAFMDCIERYNKEKLGFFNLTVSGMRPIYINASNSTISKDEWFCPPVPEN